MYIMFHMCPKKWNPLYGILAVLLLTHLSALVFIFKSVSPCCMKYHIEQTLTTDIHSKQQMSRSFISVIKWGKTWCVSTKNHLQSLFSHFGSWILPGDSLCTSTQSSLGIVQYWKINCDIRGQKKSMEDSK